MDSDYELGNIAVGRGGGVVVPAHLRGRYV